MAENEEAICRELVDSFWTAMNEWERTYWILGRIEEGKFVSQEDREAVTGITKQSHLEAHVKLFAEYVVPRQRKYGSNPGVPNAWGPKGRYHDVSLATIKSVECRGRRCAEVLTDWGLMLPGGQSVFVLKGRGDRWLIDSLKWRRLDFGRPWRQLARSQVGGAQYCNAPSVGGFVDGHVSYVKIYWNGSSGIANFPFYYEPPAGYDYKWSGN